VDLKEKLKELRVRSDRTQEETSRLLKVSTRAYSRWEKGVVTPRVKHLVRIQKLYKCKLSALMDCIHPES